MERKKKTNIILSVIVLASFLVKLVLILAYKNQLSLDSDDLNYIKSGVVMVKRGIFVFWNYNEPTLFVMPLYPMFLAGVFKVFGWGLLGLQTVRVIQAVLSSITIIIVFLIAKKLFSDRVGLITAFLMAFYMPNITTPGYILTETVFTTLLCVLIYLSLGINKDTSIFRFSAISLFWAALTLTRPTIALFPVILFIYLYFKYKKDIIYFIKPALLMVVVFVSIMAPWWIRNYSEYGEFVPLAASSGNPMLQGTYINYKQTPENIVYYKQGRNELESNREEVKAAKKKNRYGAQKEFLGYFGLVYHWKDNLHVDFSVLLEDLPFYRCHPGCDISFYFIIGFDWYYYGIKEGIPFKSASCPSYLLF